MNNLLASMPLVLNVETILFAFLGNLVGILFGAVPGFTGVMAIAIILPFTFQLESTAAIVMLFSCFCGGCFGGSISAILIGTPGAPEAAATVKDGYKLALKGESYKAICMAAFASFVGGIARAIVLFLFAPAIASWTLQFTPPEYFMLGIFGISVIAGLNEGNLLMGVTSGLLGILLSMIGMDPQSGVLRFTFGNMELYSGLNLTPIILGIFAMTKIFSGFEKRDTDSREAVALSREKLSWRDYKNCAPAIVRGTIIGNIIGIIPAAGSAIAAFISYNVEKAFSRKRNLFGTGILEGVAAPESANNAVTGSSLIPLLTLGIPGSGGAAALLGAFMMHGLAPGPFLFKNNAEVMNAIMLGFILTNVMMYIVIRLSVRGFVHIIRIPEAALITCLFVICAAGAYCNNSSWFNIAVTVVAGILAYLLNLAGIPMIPLMLGFILGPTIETNFRKAMILSDGSMSIFFTRPICIAFLLLTVAMLIGTKFMTQSMKKKADQ